MLDTVLFVAFPYVTVLMAVLVGVYRYRHDRYSYSSQSSQFLEGTALFWGSVPWHYGIITILLVHLLAALLPGPWAFLLGSPLRLYALEATGLALTLLAFAGLGLLIIRRLTVPRIIEVTSGMDWVLLAALLAQVALGGWIALFYRWGGIWYLHTAVPWLWSLVTLNPRIEAIANLPLVIKLHILGGFIIAGIFPFTRLVHVVAFPITYLWRPHQVVIWNGRPARKAGE